MQSVGVYFHSVCRLYVVSGHTFVFHGSYKCRVVSCTDGWVDCDFRGGFLGAEEAYAEFADYAEEREGEE